MGSQQPMQNCSKPWIDRFARQINDPVVRLRFLQSVAPPPGSPDLQAWHALVRLLLLPLPFLAILISFFPRGTVARIERTAAPVPRVEVHAVPPRGRPNVWQVEKTRDSEIYSNGLRIDTRFAVSNHPRAYLAFLRNGPRGSGGVRRSEPAGILFHTTESRQAPFEAQQNAVLKRIGESLLDYVRRRRAYNFLIDRFGRVYRVVIESDAANHAGYSVWSDEQWLYVNLNESFLGVSFEAQTEPGQMEPSISPAQVRAAAILTEMLRSRYGIPATNCVTHAQVSVNPSNMRVGYHTDWASSFPFEQLGLPNNYARPLPALSEFGFEYDPIFLRRAGSRMLVGVELAEESLRRRAAASGIPLLAYRKAMQKSYRERLAELRRFSSGSWEESE